MSPNIQRRLAAVTAAVLAVFVAACAEKAAAPGPPGSPRFSLTVSTITQRGAAAQKLFVVAAYFSSEIVANSDSFRLLDTAAAPVTGGSQQLSLKVDLTKCLADPSRRGSRDACSMYIGAFLGPPTFNIDTGDVFGGAYDYQILGPFDASPGHPPTVPGIDLATSRFAVNHWETDEALRLGGDQTPLFLSGPIAGVGNSSTTATLFGLTNGIQILNPNTPNFIVQPIAQLAVWQNGTWRRVNGPVNNQFVDVAAFSPTDVYIAASSGLFHYDGTAITPVSGVTREGMRSVAVSPPSASGKFVIAGTGDGGLWVGNTTTFTRYSSGQSQAMDGVCINSATEAFAQNRGNGSLFRFDGTIVASAPSTVGQSKNDLQCTGAGQAWVSAQTNPASVLRWSAGAWTQIAGPSGTLGRSLNIGVVSPNEIYAVGDSGAVNRAFYRYDGTAWREVGRLTFTGALQQRPWATPGGAYVASSPSGTLRVESVTSAGVSVVSFQPSLRDVVMPTSGSAFVVGANYFLARWNGARWTVDAPPPATPTGSILQGVWADSPNNAWVVGAQSTIARWDGARWNFVSDSRRPIVSPVDNYNAVWSTAGSVWIAGDASILRCTAAATCAPDAVSGSGALYSIWGTSATNAFAVGANGRILRYDGKSWTPMATPTASRLSRVWGSGPSDVWAVGDTAIAHFDGTAWKLMTKSIYGNQTGTFTLNPGGAFEIGLWGTGPREVYLSEWFGRIVRGETSYWGEMAGPFQNGIARVVGIGGASGGCAIAVTDGQSGQATPILMRGVGPTGCLGSAMTGPASWP